MVRALGAIAMLTLVGAVIGKITIDNDNGGSNLAADRRATTSTTAADTGTTVSEADEGNPAVGGDTSSTVATKSSTTTTRAGTANIPDPGPTKPPAAGTYRYKLADPNDTSRSSENTYVVAVQPDQNGAHVRKETYQSGQGTAENVVAYAGDAVRILTSHLGGQTPVDCTWAPPITQYALPFALNKAWSSDSKCTATVSGGKTTVERKVDDKVTGKAVDIIGNTSVRVWVVQEHSITTINNPFFSLKIDDTLTRHWSPDFGLVTFEHDEQTVNGGTDVSERTLQNLKP
jgi:hypothetical protein